MNTSLYCAHCHTKAQYACGQCKSVVYCSPQCQAQHWKNNHYQECNNIYSHGENIPVKTPQYIGNNGNLIFPPGYTGYTRLGSGSFGSVWAARSAKGEQIVVKFTDLFALQNGSFLMSNLDFSLK